MNVYCRKIPASFLKQRLFVREVCAAQFGTYKRFDQKPEEWKLKKQKRNAIATENERSKHDVISGDVLNGLVIERLSNRLLVELEPTVPGEVAKRMLCTQRSQMSSVVIVANDRVQLTSVVEEPDKGIVHKLLDRRNVLQRPSSTSSANKVALKPIASNIDQIVIVMAVVPFAATSHIDRYLVAAHSYGVPEICILVNKCDLEGSDELVKSLRHYKKLGYNVIRSSTVTEGGMTQLVGVLAGKTSVFVGQSGVGKSAIINAVLPEAGIKVGDLVNNAEVGAHTTSNAKVHHMPGGGSLVDSPGIREMGTWHLSRDSIKKGFKEIAEHTKLCKYKTCQHSEKEAAHCGVWQGMASRAIHPDRVLSFLALNKN